MSATNCRSSAHIPGFPRPSPSAASSTTSPAAISAKSRTPDRGSLLTRSHHFGAVSNELRGERTRGATSPPVSSSPYFLTPWLRPLSHYSLTHYSLPTTRPLHVR